MQTIHKATLNNSTVYLVGEENNSISLIFQKLDDAQACKAGEPMTATAVAVNNEVLSFGKSIGFIKDKVLIE